MQIYDGRTSFYQWDLNQKITSEDFQVGDEIHYFSMRHPQALVVKAYKFENKVVADVPNILLQTTNPIKVYRYVSDSVGGQTIEEETFVVNQKAQPPDYFYTETELYELRYEVERLSKEVADAVSQWQEGFEEVVEEVTLAEETRDHNEANRQESESKRILAESNRDDAEIVRRDAEIVRTNAESARKTAEATRATAEQGRVGAEELRVEAEELRVAAEADRKEWFDTNRTELANAVKASASGEVIRVDDVSPVEHTVKAKVYGKNLIAYPYYDNKTEYNGVTITDANGVLTFNGTATANSAYTLFGKSTIPVDGKYTLSGISAGTETTIYLQPYVNGVAQRVVTTKPVTYECHGEVTQISIFFKSGTTFENLVISPMLEEGDTATEYTPYIDPTTVTVTRYGLDETDNPQTYTPSADGTCEIVSLSPTMTLLTDTEGVIIDLEYNQDTNVAIGNVNADIRELDRVTAELANEITTSSVETKKEIAAATIETKKEIYNILGQTVIAETEVEDTYALRTTAGGLDIISDTKTEVERIQGSTRYDTIPVDLTTFFADGYTKNGITYEHINEYTVRISGTPTTTWINTIVIENPSWLEVGKTYTFWHDKKPNEGYTGCKFGWMVVVTDTNGNATNILPWLTYKTIEIKEGYTYKVSLYGEGFTVGESIDVTLCCMVNEGKTPNSEPFHTTFEGIKSTGKNLLDIEGLLGGAISGNGFTVTPNNNTVTLTGKPTISGTGYANWKIATNPSFLQVGKTYTFYQTSGVNPTYGNPRFGLRVWEYEGDNTTPTYKHSTSYSHFQVNVVEGYRYVFWLEADSFATGVEISPAVTVSFMVCEGATKIPYEPYIEEVYALESPVELSEWDYIDVENQQIVRRESEDAEPAVEPISCPTSYTVYNGGSESLIGDGEITVTQKYIEKVGG